LGPNEDALQGALVEAHVLLTQYLDQAWQARLKHGLGRAERTDQRKGASADPEVVEASRVAGQGRFQVLPNLGAQRRGFKDQIAPVANEELQFLPGVVTRRFDQGKTVDGREVNGGQVGIIGFDTWITGLAELFGGEGMDDADFEAGSGKSALRRMVIAATMRSCKPC